MNISRYTPMQRRVFVLCWLAYACAYMCRTNLAIALPGMMASFSWNTAMAGTIGTAFFIAYAVGQLINGIIGDKVPARSFIALGLMLSSMCNIIIGFYPTMESITLLWTINGFVLSTLWGPIVRIIGQWFTPKQQTAVAVGMNLSMIGGYILSWGLVGIMVNYTSWRAGFFLPGILALIFSLAFFILMKGKPSPEDMPAWDEDEIDHAKEALSDTTESVPLQQLLLRKELWFISAACIAQGVIKEGVSLWTPTYLGALYQLAPAVVSLLSTAIPLLSLCGIVFAGWLNERFHYEEKRTLIVLFGSCALFCLGMFGLGNSWIGLSVAMLGLISALMYGANMMLLTLIPLKYHRYNAASSITGFLDFCAYGGAGMAGTFTGLIIDKTSWNALALIWAAQAVLGIGAVYVAKHYEMHSDAETA